MMPDGHVTPPSSMAAISTAAHWQEHNGPRLLGRLLGGLKRNICFGEDKCASTVGGSG